MRIPKELCGYSHFLRSYGSERTFSNLAGSSTHSGERDTPQKEMLPSRDGSNTRCAQSDADRGENRNE